LGEKVRLFSNSYDSIPLDSNRAVLKLAHLSIHREHVGVDQQQIVQFHYFFLMRFWRIIQFLGGYFGAAAPAPC
jgi:hypothetical protein